MALFGGARDASLIRSINRELINDFIDTEIGFYKLNLEGTRQNLYGESDNKIYYSPMRINCIVQKDEKSYVGDDYGYDSTRTGVFAFLRADMVSKSIIIEEGDIVEWDNEFYEIDSVGASQYWRGINPSTDIGNTTGDRDEFGESIAIIVSGHVTRRNSLNIQEVRTGINKPNDVPRNL